MKRIFKIIIIGICLGIVLIIIRNLFQIDESVFMKGYITAAILVIIAAVIINILYFMYYRKKINNAVELFNTGKTQEFISELNEMLKKAKLKGVKNLINLNLSDGYIETKDYLYAIEILEALSEKELKPERIKLVYYINLCDAYFYTSEFDKQLDLYNSQKLLFDKYKTDNIYGGNIAELDILAAIAEKRYSDAKEMLVAAANTWHEPKFADSFKQLGEILSKAEIQNN